MNKGIKQKLALHAETVRQLRLAELGEARGGVHDQSILTQCECPPSLRCTR